jgi:hypothetical protein
VNLKKDIYSSAGIVYLNQFNSMSFIFKQMDKTETKDIITQKNTFNPLKVDDDQSPTSGYLLAMDSNGIIIIESIQFENINISVQLKVDKSTYTKPVVKNITCQKGSVVELTYPSYYSVNSIILRSSTLKVSTPNFFLITDKLIIANSFFNVTRYSRKFYIILKLIQNLNLIQTKGGC